MKTYPDAWLLGFIPAALCAVWLQPRWLSVITGIIVVGAILAAAFPLYCCLNQIRNYTKKYRSYLLSRANIFYFLAGLLCGIWWALFNVNSKHIENVYIQSKATLGYSLIETEQPVEFDLKIIGIAQDEGWRWRFDGAVKGIKIRLYWYQPEGELPKPNDIWRVSARIKPISGRLNEGGYNFQAHLLRQGIYFTGSVQSAERVYDSSGGVRLQVYQFLAEQQLFYKDIMLALMIGDRQWIQPPRWQLLQETGLAHVMAISGLHLTLVFATSWWLGRILIGSVIAAFSWVMGLTAGRMNLLLKSFTERPPQPIIDRYALLFALALALFYAALAGFAVSTLRAFLLVFIFSISRWFAWRLPPLRLLLRCIGLVLILDPLAWLDAGFWLSVGAVSAIFIWQWRGPAWLPAVSANSHEDGKRESKLGYYFSQLLSLEMVLTLALAPFAVLFFQGLPWIAPLTNLVVLPIFSALILPLCLVVVALLLSIPSSWVLHELLPILLRLTDIVLHMVFYALEVSRQLPNHWWSSLDQRFGWLFLLLLLLWFWPAAFLQRLAVALLCLPFIHVFFKPVPAHNFAVHALDVGQGTAIIVQRGRKAMIFDAGPGFRFGSNIGETTLIPFLNYHQLTPEWLIISHDHQDHTGGVQSLLTQWPQLSMQRSRFHTVEGENWGWLPQQFPEQHQAGDSWPCAWGQQWLWQGVRIKALAPLPGPSFGPNNDSCVLQLTYNGQSILLTGDIQRQTELRMVGRYGNSLQSDVLILPHHGSRTSTQAEFLAAVNPQVAVVSRGYRNHFKMPHADVTKRLEKAQVPLFDTGRSGQISIIFNGEGVNIRTFREQIRRRWYSTLLNEVDY
ncbi:DNA internalization-related competence protein ComEC/Rec2 [Idiomarina sp. A28L]|uniref:DNA internalization-related competence protein ComEC/Rec2 n=1 Tax=Idiomarina sp. A28L TaxID=1036674 RepID=UPI000213863A|nr:DNA internalization-related competence protein ComEC/Rec2 [Idiomarina sp. A28L]EGN75612.1 DNA internalization-related competence protein ComEC/Rec2 [Idiomarina sp. A28L]